jgi:tetratricopeptide (TPR) repeat protein
MTLARAPRWPLHGLLPLGLAALLGACAGRSPPPSPPSPPATELLVAAAPLAVPDTATAAILAFEQAQRAAAEAAALESRWADAAWAWDIVLALSPQDAAAQKGRQTALARAQALAAERLRLARAARTNGQIDVASRLYLEALALVPGQLEAANALRMIEHNRARRQAIGSVAGALVSPDATRSEAQARAAARRLDLEHASLLADQGDIDAAVALLLPTTTRRSGDASRRKLLAELLLKRADQLAASDPAAAIESLRQSLRWQPGLAGARARLQQLLADAQAGANAPGQRRPLSKPSSAPSSGR